MSANPTANARESTQTINPLKALADFGQSVWLDYIRRNLITTGELARLIQEDGLRGMTSNPAIFEKAITGSTDYSKELEELSQAQGSQRRRNLRASRDSSDIQDAADALRGVYDSTKRRDGYVSLEVSPYLAFKTQETIDEAVRLWKTVNRPNLMVKVPGTREGIPAIRELISRGININVTLLFAQDVYEQVAEAFIAGLETLVEKCEDPSGVASVASFFVSRIDSLVDSLLDAKIKEVEESVRSGALPQPAGQNRDRQRQARLSVVQKYFQRSALARACGARRADPAPALGQHQHEESGLPRRDVRRRTHRSRYGRHDSAGHLRRVSRSRPSARQS